MSLFESKIWWTTKLSPNVEYDQYHLAVGRFGGSEESNRVVVGGYDGLIKVYEPRESGYKPSHAILEKAEGRPILQVLGGKLDENSEEDVLAVLFANGFVVYSFHQGQEGLMLKNEGRDDSITRLCYNMTFCYMADETLLAIQTQDGLVYFYNKSSRICSFQMADIVVPSPLIFLKKKKSLCLQNACLQMQSYKYQTIFSNQSTASSSIKPEWETTLGELALSMDQYQSSEDTLLVVGCEQHIYVLKTSNGKIDHLKRLQCIPSTVMVSQTKADTKDLVLIVSSFSHHILFYKNFELVWATKTTNVAHGLKIGTFGKNKGMMVTINDEGHLDILYLGVDVPQLTFQNVANREQSYEELRKESVSLKSKIQAKSSEKVEVRNSETLSIKCSITQLKTEKEAQSDKIFTSELGVQVSSKLKVSLGFSGLEATNISVVVKHPEAIVLDSNHYNVEVLKGNGSPHVFDIEFAVDNRIPLTEQFLEVIATYQFMSSGNSQTGVAYKKATIPLEVYSYLVSPVKEADFKLTLVSNLDFPALSEIFASFIQASAPNPEYYANPNALSFLLNDGAITTMIVAKNSSTKSLTADKIRIQGNDFDSLFLLMTELEQRMKQTSPNFKLEYKEELPFKDLFDVLTERKSIASNFLRVSEEMAEKTHELLLIQKRLLTRYKEKNNAALNNLDILLEASFNDLLAMSKESDKLQLLYRRNSQRVSISIRIILRLLKMSFPISEDGFQLLQMYLPVFVEPSVERIGWIEIMDLNIFYLLKNVLLGKEDSGAKEYAEVESVEVFKQHFVMLVNKLNQGLLANYKAPADEK